MTIRWFVPGRIEVFGKHTDYAGGRSLVCAVPRGVTIEAESSADGRVIVEDETVGERAEFTTTGEGDAEGWRCYPRTVLRRLAANFPGAQLSARLRVSSDLPQAAGISSSTAFLVGIAESLIDRAGLEHDDRWRAVIRAPEDRAGYFGCIENGASFGPLAGDEGFGTHGGSEDHAAIVMSEANELRAFSYSPITLESVASMPSGWTFVVVSSGVTARKAGNVQERYNRLSLDTVALVDAWRETHPGDRRPLGRLAREGALHGWQPPRDLAGRLEHFVTEDAYVADASLAFTRGDIAAIGDLATASQAGADRLLQNQIDETRALVTLGRDIGAPASSAFGAGWGGSVWALVKEGEADAFLSEWHAAYRKRFPERPSEGFVSPPSAGIRRVPAPNS